MLKLYNSLTRRIEDFKPINPPHVGMYTCGPTVYSFASIGNFRTYTMADLLLRTLQHNQYEVQYIMNLTDVGHLTGDNMGDPDTGEDRMEKSAKKEGKTAWEVAEFYTEAFLEDFEHLNLLQPEKFTKATDHIKEQIDLVKKLEEKGFTYKTSDGIYFDTTKFPEYGALSNLDQIKEGARVEVNPEKKSPRDFALWKFSVPRHSGDSERSVEDSRIDSGQARMTEKRHMEWDSPWVMPDGRQGIGFPGWHIECSAMSMKYLGESFDIHTGGIDLRETHHPNEIAQSEAVTGKPFAKYWFHVAFLLVNGQKMSKSLGNVYRVYDLMKDGYDPLAIRYLYLQTHYRQEMNFTFVALDAAQNALQHLRKAFATWDASQDRATEYEKRFLAAVNDDLNMPEALSVVWEMVKADIPSGAKASSLLTMDQVLGLKLTDIQALPKKIDLSDLPAHIQELIKERNDLRKQKRFVLADQIRNKLKKIGYDVLDTKDGFEIKKI